MGKITSATCVQAIIAAHGGKAKDWKRQFKKKGADNSWVRIFENVRTGEVVKVTEDKNGGLNLVYGGGKTVAPTSNQNNSPVNISLIPAVSNEYSDLTGRVIYDLSDSEFDLDNGRFFFYCGPETTDNALHDDDDGGTIPKLKQLFADMNFTAWESENLHSVEPPDGMSTTILWSIIESRLRKAGAVQM